MSVAVSIARGHGASYPFKTTGTAESPVINGQCGAGYYLSVVEKGGRARRSPAVRVRVGPPARQQGPGDRRVPRDRDRPVLLAPGADHEDHARGRRACMRKTVGMRRVSGSRRAWAGSPAR